MSSTVMKKISIKDLKPGMYVQKIVEQKGHLSIKSQGRVTSQAIVETLKKRGVKSLIIDTSKAFSVDEEEQPVESTPATEAVSSKPTVSLENELVHAVTLHEQGKLIQKELLDCVKKEQPFDVSIPKEFSESLVQSVDRNPDALLCLTKIREKDDYLLEHSLNVAILLANFGRHLGMSDTQIHELSYAGFLHDLGKIKIPDNILHKPGRLTDKEMVVMKRHVEFGVEYLRTTDIDRRLIRTISEHHERLDGLGYPLGKKADAISKPGRMLAIADMYDALTADRVYKHGMSSQKAFSIMLSDAPTRLDLPLVQQFIKCMGVFPVGSLVLLSNERVAMVIEQTSSPLSPVVKEFYSARNRCFLKPRDINLTVDKNIKVIKAVIANDYKIDVNGFFEQSVSVG